MHCKQCGHQLSDPQQFCPECGSKIEIPEKQVKKKGKGFIWLIAGVSGFFLLAIIAVFVLYNVGKSKYTPDILLDNFEAAIESEDQKTLSKLLTSDEKSFEITEQEVTNFIQYLKDNPNTYNDLKTKLHEQLESIQEFNMTAPERGSVYGEVYVRKAGKKWVVFDEYELVVVPAYIDLTIKNGELDIYINDEQLATLNDAQLSDTFGPFMPGTYNVKAVFENAYAASEEEKEIEVFESGLQNIPYEFAMEIEEIALSSGFIDYDLYIDGEKTDIPVSDASKMPIGEFPTNGTIVAQVGKDFPWGSVISDEVPIDKSHLVFEVIHPLTNDEQIELYEDLNDIMLSYIDALSEEDMSLLSDRVSDNVRDTLDETMIKVHRRNSNYNAKVLSVNYDADRIENPHYDEHLEAYTIMVNAEYMFYEPNGTINWAYAGGDSSTDEYKYLRELTVFYNEETESWMLNDLSKSYAFVFDRNAEIFEFD